MNLYTSEFKLLTDFVEIDFDKISSKYTNSHEREKEERENITLYGKSLENANRSIKENKILFTLRKATIGSEGKDRRFLQRLACIFKK